VIATAAQPNNVEALGCLAILYMRHTNFADDKSGDGSVEMAAKRAAREGFTLLQVRQE
jgi:hypothetical protein